MYYFSICAFLIIYLLLKREHEMDELFEKSLLYDFYGELLTEHQRAVYESFVFEDMSLAEVAAEQGITRQGVHDLVKRCEKILQDYEEKLHLVEKFVSIRNKTLEIAKLTDGDDFSFLFDENGKQIGGTLTETRLLNRLSGIRKLTNEILEEL